MVKVEHRICEGTVVGQSTDTVNCSLVHHLETTSVQGNTQGVSTHMGTFPTFPHLICDVVQDEAQRGSGQSLGSRYSHP
jgi:hypothetical protein